MGRDGSRAYYKDLRVEKAPFLQKGTIETHRRRGHLRRLLPALCAEIRPERPDEERLAEMLTFANAAASIITTRKGALRVMPEAEEVERFLSSVDRSSCE